MATVTRYNWLAAAVIRRAAHVNHWGRYALLVLMPATGFLATNARGSLLLRRMT